MNIVLAIEIKMEQYAGKNRLYTRHLQSKPMGIDFHSSISHFWNAVKSWPLRLKRYLKAQIQLGSELKVLSLQAGAVIFLAIPKAFELFSIGWAIILMLIGALFQFIAMKETRKRILHESFLKDRLNDFFDDRSGMEEDEAAEYYKQKLTQCLYHIMEQLGFHHSPNHRIRLYIPIEDSGLRKFSVVAFHADNPDLGHSRPDLYPDDGVLGHAYRHGCCDISKLADSNEDEQAWRDQQKNIGLLKTDDAVSLVKFKARSYYAFAIRDTEKKIKAGVIIIESNKTGTIYPYLVNNLMESQYAWYLEKCLKRFTKYAPNPNFASEKGF